MTSKRTSRTDTKPSGEATTLETGDTPNVPAVLTSEDAATEFQGAFDAKRFRAGLAQRLENRRTLIEWVRGNLHEGTDYGRIHVVKKDACPEFKQTRQCGNAYHWSKPSLWKPGAEKICGMLGWVPAFPNLSDYTRMIRAGRPIEQIALQCVIYSGGRVIGEGIGARDLRLDGGDLNKALKMCKKSAHIDATLIAAGLSEIFTQDYGERPDEDDDDEGAQPADQYAPGIERGKNPMGPPQQRLDVTTHCTFGKKHRGEPWSRVPADYLDWIAGNVIDKPDVLEAVRAEIERRQSQPQEYDPRRPHAQGSKSLADHARAISAAKSIDECTAAYEASGDRKPSLKKAYDMRVRELEQRARDQAPM